MPPITLTATASSGLAVSYSRDLRPRIRKRQQADNHWSGVSNGSGGASRQPNYAAATPVSITFTVNPAAQTISFPNPGTQTFGVSPITLTATASSGLAVSYTVTSGPATVSGSKLTITGAGSVTVQAGATRQHELRSGNSGQHNLHGKPGSDAGLQRQRLARLAKRFAGRRGQLHGYGALHQRQLWRSGHAEYQRIANRRQGQFLIGAGLTRQQQRDFYSDGANGRGTSVTQSHGFGWTLASPGARAPAPASGWRRRKKPARKFLVIVAILTSVLATALIAGCGGGFALGKGSATYTLTITGASGNDITQPAFS